MFADDTACFLEDSDIQNLQLILNSELLNISNWMKANKLSVNLSKTNYIIFRPRNKKLNHNLKLFLNGEELKRISHTKYLGIFIDEHLKCNYQSKLSGK